MSEANLDSYILRGTLPPLSSKAQWAKFKTHLEQARTTINYWLELLEKDVQELELILPTEQDATREPVNE